jgi:aquaporin NIP
MNTLAAEFFGTFALVFAGTGAIVGIALTFGLVVLAMIYTVRDVSGAHLNPAHAIRTEAGKCEYE